MEFQINVFHKIATFLSLHPFQNRSKMQRERTLSLRCLALLVMSSLSTSQSFILKTNLASAPSMSKSLYSRTVRPPFTSISKIPSSSTIQKHQNRINRTPHKCRSSNTALHMAAVTKSGGKPILTTEQFQIEVLELEVGSDDEAADEVSESNDKSDGSGKNDSKGKKFPTLVFFSAPWCGPCRLSNPVVKEIIKTFPLLNVVEVCTDDLPEVAEESGVVSIPTIQLYHEGRLLDTIVGCVAKNVLASAVKKVIDDLELSDCEEKESSNEEEEGTSSDVEIAENGFVDGNPSS